MRSLENMTYKLSLEDMGSLEEKPELEFDSLL